MILKIPNRKLKELHIKIYRFRSFFIKTEF